MTPTEPVGQLVPGTVTRLSVNINAETAQWLRDYAQRHGCSITEAVRRAVSIAAFVQGEADAGHKLLSGGREVLLVG